MKIFNILKKIRQQLSERKRIEGEVDKKISHLNRLIEEADNRIELMKKMQRDIEEGAPWLSKHISLIFYNREMEAASYLAWKARPAQQASQTVKQYAEENRRLREELIRLENIANTNRRASNGYSPVNAILVPSPNTKTGIKITKSQQDDESDMKIGFQYEVQVGKVYERKGYTVIYNGLDKGRGDFGIDLICYTDDLTLLIQCKCWKKTTKINRNVILKLIQDASEFIEYNRRKPNPPEYINSNLKIILVTTTVLDRNASKLANEAEIHFKQEFHPVKYNPND